MEPLPEMKRYEKYKDSGVEWLDKVPASWDLTRLGTRFLERKSKVSDVDYPPLSVTKQGILPQLENAAKTKDGGNRKLVKKGDFVINSRSDRKGSSGVSDRDGSVSLINIVLKPICIHPKFSEHLLKSYAFIEEYYRVGRGIVADLWTTRYDEMRTVTLAVPSYDEQTAIANFLDKKTALVDDAIAIKEKQIALLKERKQIIIQKAVSQGLNPDAPMKDSGVDWIGQIPKNWNVIQVRRILNKIEQGSSPQLHNNIDSTKYSVLKISAVKNGVFFENEKKLVLKRQFESKYRIRNGDFLLTRGNTPELVADSCLVSGLNSEFIMMSDLIYRLTFNLQNIDLNYVLIYFQSIFMREQIKKAARGSSSTMVKVSQEHIKSFFINLPPLIEQRAITKNVNEKSQAITKATAHLNFQIEKLKEYKTTLINSAVTGKIKVA